MGTLGLSGVQPAAFNADIFKNGIDMGRFKGEFIPGHWRVNAAATIRPGQLVAFNTSNEIILCTGANHIGVAKFKKFTLGQAVNADEPISFPASNSTVSLKRGNVSNVQVRSAVQQGGTQYVGGGTDYSVNTTNGTITQVSGGAPIPLNTIVYVTYTFSLVAADYQLLGQNFFNSNDDVTVSDSRLAIIMGPAILYTTEYDTSRTYSLNGANSTLYSTSSGQFTNASGNEFVGKCIQLPQATDPFLGVWLNAAPILI